eukprot:scaffold299807_cov15-Prasinocladus_malaysianus.AAC.1
MPALQSSERHTEGHWEFISSGPSDHRCVQTARAGEELCGNGPGTALQPVAQGACTEPQHRRDGSVCKTWYICLASIRCRRPCDVIIERAAGLIRRLPSWPN